MTTGNGMQEDVAERVHNSRGGGPYYAFLAHNDGGCYSDPADGGQVRIKMRRLAIQLFIILGYLFVLFLFLFLFLFSHNLTFPALSRLNVVHMSMFMYNKFENLRLYYFKEKYICCTTQSSLMVYYLLEFILTLFLCCQCLVLYILVDPLPHK